MKAIIQMLCNLAYTGRICFYTYDSAQIMLNGVSYKDIHKYHMHHTELGNALTTTCRDYLLYTNNDLAVMDNKIILVITFMSPVAHTRYIRFHDNDWYIS